MDNDNFLNFLETEYHTAVNSLDANKPLGKISEELQTKTERYQDITLIDQGAMKLISQVHDRVTDRYLVMAKSKKPEDKNINEHFLREARITASLQHPNIVPIHDIGFDTNSEPYFIMKLIDGVSFDKYLNQQHSLLEKLNVFLKICDAIAFAHSQGVVHLDLKPVNVRVGTHGEVIVCDWGLAKVLYENCNEEILKKDSLDSCNLQLTLYGRGTPGYMAPEQFKNNECSTQLSDIYSLGAILYTILTNRSPISDESYEDIKRRTINGDIKPPSLARPDESIPISLEAVCMKALNKVPAERYQTAQELISEIQAYLNGFAPKAEKAGFLTLLKLLYFRNKAIIQLSLAALILIIGVLSWFISQLKSSESQIRAAYDELQTEVKLRHDAEAEALKGSKKEAWEQLKAANLNSALDQAKQALHYDSNDAESLHLVTLTYMAKFDFENASKYAALLPEGEFIQLQNKIANLQKADKENIPYILVIREFQNRTFATLYHHLVKELMPTLKLKKKQEFTRQLVNSLNPGVKLEEINFSADNKTLTIKTRTLNLLPPLNGSGVENIDVSYSSINRIHTINSMSIKKLNLAGNPISFLDITSKCRENIVELNLQSTYFSHIPDAMPNLESLNIAHCKIGSYDRLLNMKKLKKLTINKGQLPHNISTALKCTIIEL